MALGIGAACIGALELLQLPPEAVVGPVIIATMLLPYQPWHDRTQSR
jgi:hypothetical protein